MDNFTFRTPTEFAFGRGQERHTGELLKRYGASRVLIVIGGGSVVRSGLLQRVVDSIENEGIAHSLLSGVRPNPTDTLVREGIALAREFAADFILAVGGGSVIDTAKAIALGVPYAGDFWDFFSKKAEPTQALPVGVVLTIPAAGSEGSGNSVITRVEGRHKISVRYPMLLRPLFAVMNPELTMTLPWAQTANGIADMLCHIYERYFSPTQGTQLVDSYSEAIMRSVMEEAATLRENPDDYDARANVMWASTLAHNGLCGVGKVEDWASHRLEHEVSAFYDVAHGAGLAVIVPAWMAFVARRSPAKVEQYAVQVMGVDPSGLSRDEVIAEGIRRQKEFYHSLGLTTSLRELIGCEPDIDGMVASLEGNMGPQLGGYVVLSMADCAEIYRAAL